MIYINRKTKRSISLPVRKKNGWDERVDFIFTPTAGLIVTNVNPTFTTGEADLNLDFDIAADDNTPLGFHKVTITGNPAPPNPVTINVTIQAADAVSTTTAPTTTITRGDNPGTTVPTENAYSFAMFMPDEGDKRIVYTSTDIGTGGYIIKTTKISDTQLQVAPGQGGYFFIVAGADVPIESSPALQDVVAFRSATPWAANWGDTGLMTDPAGKVTSSTGIEFDVDTALIAMYAIIPTFSDGLSKSEVYASAIREVSQKAYKVATRIRLNEGDIINTVNAIAPTAPSERWGNSNFRGLAIVKNTPNGNALGYNNASTIEVLAEEEGTAVTSTTTLSPTSVNASLGFNAVVTTDINAQAGLTYTGTITLFRNGNIIGSTNFNWIAPATPGQSSFTCDTSIPFSFMSNEDSKTAAETQFTGQLTATVNWEINGVPKAQLFGSATFFSYGTSYPNITTDINFTLPE